MGLTEDILGSASLFLRQFDWILDPDCCLLSVWLGGHIHLRVSAEYLPSSEENCQQPRQTYLTISDLMFEEQ